jgi:hypothetical protein
MEKWKDVEYEDIKIGSYQVSNLGRIRNRKGKIIRADVSNAGYLRINFATVSDDGKATQRKHMVHRIVASAFVNRPEGCDIVNHLDGDKQNNSATNLEWTTYSGNMEHAHATRLRVQDGSKNPGNVYPEQLIELICSLRQEGCDVQTTIERCLSEFPSPGFTPHKVKVLINHIRAGRRWTTISSKYPWYSLLGSTTIPSGSTPQAIGGGNAGHPSITG